MTNYEYIKNMGVEEMAEFLDGVFFSCILCSEDKRLSDNPLTKYEKCDSKCTKHCKEWLESEAKFVKVRLY